jgi:hypothetical protein
MKYEAYVAGFVANPDYSRFEFVSIGKKGEIPKRILFTPTPLPNVYNLAFGDIIDDEDIDDYNISDNGDRNKILATVLKAVDLYTKKYPDRWVYFTGSTEHRTRLYRMAVSLHLEELMRIFDIFAEIDEDEEFVRFQKGLNIRAFLIKRNLLNLKYEKSS